MVGSSVYDQHNEHAKRCDPRDFWGQVRRTINGRPVTQDQIDMIVRAIVSGLELEPTDTLLDLGCGNGVLTDLIFERCAGGVGVDFADYLIGVAQANFARADRVYVRDDVAHYVAHCAHPQPFTRVLCYGAFQYFPPEFARESLVMLRRRFPNVTRVFLGNLPDRARVRNFYPAESYVPGIEDDHASAIGIWRSQAEFVELARACGWEAQFESMPQGFFAAHYRYDVVLRPV